MVIIVVIVVLNNEGGAGVAPTICAIVVIRAIMIARAVALVGTLLTGGHVDNVSVLDVRSPLSRCLVSHQHPRVRPATH